MSVCRKLPDGTIQKIAGHTILLDANASEVREGTFTVPVVQSGNAVPVTVTFTDPMPDTDYAVVLSDVTNSSAAVYGEVFDKQTTGFTVQIGRPYSYGPSTGGTAHYIAWKPVKIEGYTALQNKVENPDDTPTIDSMNLVTSDGVARAIENASAVWKGTRAEWNALPATDKVKYDLAVLLDQTLVKAVDRETGDENNVADLTKVFTGTDAAWSALSTAEKTSYALSATSDRDRLHAVDRDTGDVTEIADLSKVWRGTQAEWDAMSAAEKDEWNVAHIENGSPVFSKHIFPDYAHPITIPSGTTTWTATEDVYVNWLSINNQGEYCYLYADGHQISTYSWYDAGHGAGSFAGYIKKGTVLSAPLLYGTNVCKIFPLL